MVRFACPQCGGEGSVPLEEDGGLVDHACYHCYTDGYLEMSEADYVEYVNELLSEAAAEDAQRQLSVDL